MNAFKSCARACLVWTVTAVALINAGCANDAQVINQAADAHTQLKPAVMRDPELSGYLQEVGDRILDAGKQMAQQGKVPKSFKSEDADWMFSNRVKFHLVNSPTLNAFTTGGEHMYIYNALLQKCRTEDELAAVMAHEFAHIYCRHIHQGMNRQKGMLGAVVVGAAAGAALGGDNRVEAGVAGAGLAAVVAQFAGLKFTRDDENQADEYGFAFYWRAGWDPKRFGDFFKQLADAGMDKTPEMMSDHPSLKSRVEAAQQRARKLGGRIDDYRKPPVADASRFAAIQRRAAALGREVPQDKTMEQAQRLLASFNSCVSPVEQPEQVKARKELTRRK